MNKSNLKRIHFAVSALAAAVLMAGLMRLGSANEPIALKLVETPRQAIRNHDVRPPTAAPDDRPAMPPRSIERTDDPKAVHLHARSFVPAGADLGAAPADSSSRYFVVSYDPARRDAFRRGLNERGVRVLQAVPPNALAVSAPVGTSLDDVDGLESAFTLTADDRMSVHAVATVAADPKTPVPFLFEFFKGVGRQDAVEALAGFGIVAEAQGGLPENVVLAYAAPETLWSVAETESIAWILPASEKHVETLEEAHYCLGAMTDEGEVASFSANGDGWDGPGLGSAALTYFWATPTPDLSVAQQRAQILAALAKWSEVAQVSFSETSNPTAVRSLRIHFGAGSHGDAYPFNGPGGVLAHCFYPSPPNSEPIAGDMHFDEDETWKIGQNIDLFSVALHEAGHGLGLKHSSDPGAVMYPYYGGPVTGLHQDDIDGIRSIYAANTPATLTPPTGLSPTGGASIDTVPIALSWNAVPTATWYQVWVATGTAASYTFLKAEWVQGATSFSFAPPGAGDYVFWVKGWNASQGHGPWSAAAEFSYAPAVLTAPTGLTPDGGAQVAGSPVTVSWNAVGGATWYYVYLATGTPGNYTFVGGQWVQGATSLNVSLPSAGGYVFWVKPWNATQGNGPWSAPATFNF